MITLATPPAAVAFGMSAPGERDRVMASVVVRRARTGDTSALLGLVARYREFEGLSGFRPDAIRTPMERLLSSPAIGAAWLAGDARQPLGYLMLV